MIEVDQYKEYSDAEIDLARCVNLIVQALWKKDGTLRDFTDKEGRAALKQTIDRLPSEIPANLRAEDKKLLKDTIKECQETKKIVKNWFWWIVGTMFLASATMTLCAVMMLR